MIGFRKGWLIKIKNLLRVYYMSGPGLVTFEGVKLW